jgi:hypothetical protein
MSDRAPDDEEQVLRDARAKAARLFDDLTARARDLEHFAGRRAPEAFEPGRRAFADAIGSTRAVIDRLDAALKQGSEETDEGR